MGSIILSDEQQYFIDLVCSGHNVLVDACIGSGKTTSIQYLCSQLFNKKILYLTYNALLKVDARKKLKAYRSKVTATNYHGYAYGLVSGYFRRNSFRRSTSRERCIFDLIDIYTKGNYIIPRYDVLVIDEYQDIDQEIADMLSIIKEANPGIQLVAVGDLHQKIYDKTALKVGQFISDYLGTYKSVEFTQCFRISPEHANNLAKVWGMKIIGVNKDCTARVVSFDEAYSILSKSNPGDILCLGSNRGVKTPDLIRMLNKLESNHSDIFNKDTVYAKRGDSDEGDVNVSDSCAVFVPYDSSKGMERDICAVFNWTDVYWKLRCGKPNVNFEIVKNIFCVAASRGKKQILFVEPYESGQSSMLAFEDMYSSPCPENHDIGKVAISSAFDYKRREDIVSAYDCLECTQLQQKSEVIELVSHDGMIDLSACIGNYLEYLYFTGKSIDKDIGFYYDLHNNVPHIHDSNINTLEKKVLYLEYLNTGQLRYKDQVSIPFVSGDESRQIFDRLHSQFTREEQVQKECTILTNTTCSLLGFADVVKNHIVWELKFVSELQVTHFLQCALYMVALQLEEGVLWNIKTGEMWGIRIPDKNKFMNGVIKAVSKGYYEDCHWYVGETIKGIISETKDEALAHFANLY